MKVWIWILLIVAVAVIAFVIGKKSVNYKVGSGKNDCEVWQKELSDLESIKLANVKMSSGGMSERQKRIEELRSLLKNC